MVGIVARWVEQISICYVLDFVGWGYVEWLSSGREVMDIMTKKEDNRDNRRNILGVRISNDEKNYLKDISSNLNESQSEVIRRLIKEEHNRIHEKYEWRLLLVYLVGVCFVVRGGAITYDQWRLFKTGYFCNNKN